MTVKTRDEYNKLIADLLEERDLVDAKYRELQERIEAGEKVYLFESDGFDVFKHEVVSVNSRSRQIWTNDPSYKPPSVCEVFSGTEWWKHTTRDTAR